MMGLNNTLGAGTRLSGRLYIVGGFQVASRQ